jgi:hypothetical protein
MQLPFPWLQNIDMKARLFTRVIITTVMVTVTVTVTGTVTVTVTVSGARSLHICSSIIKMKVNRIDIRGYK